MTGLRRVLLATFVVGLAASITVSQTALTLLVLLWLWQLRDPATRRELPRPLLGPVLAFSGVTLMSALLSGHPGGSLWDSKDLLLVLVLYVIAHAVPGVDRADRFLTALGLAVAVVGVIGVVQVAACPSAPPQGEPLRWFLHRCHRARGFFSIYMTLAGVLLMLLLATAPRLLPGGPPRWWFLPAWLGMVAGLGASYVRGAWLGLAGGMLALLATVRRGRALLIAVLLLMALAAIVGPERLRERVRSIGDRAEGNIMERTHMWRSGLAMWREHRWLGVGPGGVKRLYAAFALPEAVKKRTGHVHNTPLQILIERGLIGLLAWLWIWVAFYARAGELLRSLPADRSRERALVAGSLAAVTGFLVHGLSEYNFGDSETVMVAWTIMALPFAVAREGGAPEQAHPQPAEPGAIGMLESSHGEQSHPAGS